ncbi:cbb3-type cytochrome oxidase assembly protein CcoS [Arenibacterium halophilum]|uniref:Cbb3-type cytochrome oxidase assembly protein CcoS n=1 Tax=Arenibacterium halophilum TaxID=2583821 RepID=A0ABY2XET0_9RHOB|nr:cbb3-type cytochrome oxidase assembly protein CcoS [Arenibacterium halophilum]TMV14968.1 cbb3-type cytochrome oxidase assembly protein CcoS [Arenibacterium halophilum]
MTILYLLIPLTMVMGAVGLLTFFWTLNNGQYDDPQGDAQRILQSEDRPLLPTARPDEEKL